MRVPTVRFATRLYLAGFAAAMVIQGAGGRRFARDTRWGYNGGWQREIAMRNAGTLVTAAGLAGQGAEAERAQLRGYLVLSALFGPNHLIAAVRSPRSWSNWGGAIGNAVGLGIGLAALAGDRPRARAVPEHDRDS